MERALEVLAFAAGAAVVMATFLSAVMMVVVPRGVPVRLSRIVFLATRRVFELRARFADTYEERDRTMALYAPFSLMVLPMVWLALVLGGFTLIFWSLGTGSVIDSLEAAGSSVTTLGFVGVAGAAQYLAAFAGAAIGLLLLALLITYLPSMYAAFSRREVLVGVLAIQAGTPPTAAEMIIRFHQLSDLDDMDEEVWRPWSTGFVDIEETHTSLGALPFFRSPDPHRSWVTATGAVLDAAGLISSTVDVPRQPAAELCIRAGYLALRSIADFYSIPYDPDPDPGDPISVHRQEWESVCDQLAAAGVPLVADRDQAWKDFAGWRVNYDTVLTVLAGFTMAPYAPWSSDRSPAGTYRPPVARRWQTHR